MRNIVKMVGKEIERGNIGADTSCPYHPCHFTGQNCSFCYCPYYPCGDTDLGEEIPLSRGGTVWSCSNCLFIHRDGPVEFAYSKIAELGLTPDDPRWRSEVLPEAKKRFLKKGKALMIIGTTSDAGKSLTAAAIGRLLHRRGYLVAPFKGQNMSLNSKVTPHGEEIAQIQSLQAQAFGLTASDIHMNPILLKPIGNSRSQVILEGRPFADYDAAEYYSDFVLQYGVDTVARNIEWLKKRYDVVLMEGAGSAAEINLYDYDISNMRAAEIADADCILVTNVEWGGSYAYIIGTIDLMPEKGRKRIKGIIFNNVRGRPEDLRACAHDIEEMTGIPVIGIVPHIDADLPSEDSEALRGRRRVGDGPNIIAVVRLPRISNFTDLDPIYGPDFTVVFADTPEEIRRAGAIIIPGTKNTISDLGWMDANGISDAIREMRGKVPILGICGGYQMMGRTLHDPNGIESGMPGDFAGLGLFDNETHWDGYAKVVRSDHAEMADGSGKVEGYEIHMGVSTVREKPLFRIVNIGRPDEDEGSVREDEMLFGTYLHGCLDKPAFRKKFLSLVKGGSVSETFGDYRDVIEKNLDILADGFESGLDMDALIRILGGGE